MADEEAVAPVQDRIDALFDEPEPEPTPEPEVDPEVDPEPEVDPDPDPDAGDEPDPDPEPQTVDIERDGVMYEVPIALQDAFMREKDYTEKTQDVATKRKEVEIQHQNLELIDGQYKFALQVQDDVLQAHQLDQQIKQARQYMRDNIDGMSHIDLEKIRMGIDEVTQQRDTIINAVSTKNTEFQQAREQSLKELAAKSTEVLRQKVPGWDDTHEGQIKDYALSLGIPEQTYVSVVDPIEKIILHKAMQFDALQVNKSAAVKKVVSTPSIKAKARNPMPENVKAKLNLKKSLRKPGLSSKAKAKLIEKSMGDRLG